MTALLPNRPKLPDGSVQNVPIGEVRQFRAGVYVNQDVSATFQAEGDPAHVFRLLAVETDDVVFIDDPDVPGHRLIPVLEKALRVQGAGPIDIKKGQAVLLDVEFDCPADPAQKAFKASVGPLGIPISATVNLGSVSGVTLASPSDMAPGETRNFAFQLFSSLGHAVNVVLDFDPAFDNQFSAPRTAFVTVPPAGGTASVTVPITCATGAAEGLHHIGFNLLEQSGTSLGLLTTDVTVVGGTLVITIDPLSTAFKMIAGSIAPVNVTVQSVRGGATDVSFRVAEPPEFGASGPPIHVGAGATTRGTVWLLSSPAGPPTAQIKLTAFSFASQATLLPPISVSVADPPGRDEFVVLRVYWGGKWAAGNPFSFQQMEQAIFRLIRGAYFSGLKEYGILTVGDVAVSNAPGLPRTVLPPLTVEPTFPSSNDFDDDDVRNLLTGLINAGRLPRPDEIVGTAYYYVMPQQGSFYRPDTEGILGRHDTFSFGGSDHLFAWGYQGMTVDGTSPTFAHELVEAVCAKPAGMEIGDPCQKLSGTSNGVTVQPYLSKQRGLCVLPDMTSNSAIAATPPVTGKTG